MEVSETLPHGTAVLRRGRHVVGVTGVAGTPIARIGWDADRLVSAVLTLPDGGEVMIASGGPEHPVLGAVESLCVAGGAAVGSVAAVDWVRPTVVPAVAESGALPAGAHAAVLNLVAVLARSADVPELRFGGSRPNAGLLQLLSGSFIVHGDPRAPAVADTSAKYRPAPFEWSWPHPQVCVQRRDGVEQIYVAGHAFQTTTDTPRRVVVDARGHVSAVVMLGSQPWATVVTPDSEGELTAGPDPLPEAPAERLGQPMAPALVALLMASVAERAPQSIRQHLRDVLRDKEIVWGDPGLQLARSTERGLEVHGGLEAALPSALGVAVSALLPWLEPLLLGLARARLSEAHDALERR